MEDYRGRLLFSFLIKYINIKAIIVWHNETPHLLDSIPYCLTNGVQFKGIEDWEIYFNRKADRKIKMYEECPIKYENGQAFIDYINAHRYLLSGRPRTYQHGDYHIGNMMIGNDKQLYIIDFNRNDFGDPWEEFNRIVWCAQAAPLFATGMVNGYFDNDVPVQFWELLALYISSNTLSSVPWAIPFGQSKIQVMVNQAKDVLSWYDNMTKPVPTWYKEVINK